MSKKFFWMFFCLILAACAAAPSLDGAAGAPAAEPPQGSDAEPPPAMPVSSPRSNNQPPTVPTWTPSPAMSALPPPPVATQAAFASFSPILFRKYVDRYYSFQLLGGYADGNWLKDDQVVAQIQYEKLVTVYDANGWYGETPIHDVTSLDPPFCGSTYIGTDMVESKGWQFAFYQGWQVTQRPATDIPIDSPTYVQGVREWLTAQGIADPVVQLTRIAKVDLEGDGSDEVFITATYFKTPNPQSPLAEFGDYSVVLMRKVSGNTVVTVPLAADVYHLDQPEPVFPLTYLLSNFIDLNQDGNLEVILEATRWEGGGIILYEVEGLNTIQVIKEICGG